MTTLEGGLLLFVTLLVVFGVYWLVAITRLTETGIQEVVHSLEQGGWVRRFKIIILISAILAHCYLWFLLQGGQRLQGAAAREGHRAGPNRAGTRPRPRLQHESHSSGRALAV